MKLKLTKWFVTSIHNLVSRAMSWLAKSRQLVITVVGYCRYYSLLRRCQLFNYFSHLGFLACRKARLVRGTYFSVSPSSTTTLRAHSHQHITIDCGGADGRAEGTGSAEPGLSTDQGSVGAPVEQVAVPGASPRPSVRDKEGVRYRTEKEG